MKKHLCKKSAFSSFGRMPASRARLLAVMLGLAALNSACVPLVLGGAAVAGGSVVLTDRRTPAMQLTDKNIEYRVQSEVSSNFPSISSHIRTTAYNQKVLLTGEIATEQDKSKAGDIARNSQDVTGVVNQLTVGPVTSFDSRAQDSLLDSQVRAQLIAASGVPSRTILITVNQKVVYLMGQVTPAEADAAAQAASQVSGVAKVIKAFDVNANADKPAASDQGAASSADTASSSATAPASGTGSSLIPDPAGAQPAPASAQPVSGSDGTQTYPLK